MDAGLRRRRRACADPDACTDRHPRSDTERLADRHSDRHSDRHGGAGVVCDGTSPSQ
jgi:hypothetical protein